MTAYILRRLLWLAPVLLAIAVITFVLMHVAPGSPCRGEKIARAEALAACEESYGLNEPVWERFGHYLLGLAQGDLGFSLERRQPVSDVLAGGAGVSATLGLLALVLSAVAGVALGTLAALRRNTLVDYGGVALASAGASVPSFILGLLLLILFVGQLHWFPSAGWGRPEHVVLPVIALSALPAAYIARVTRAAVLDALGQDYTRTALAKGLRQRVIVTRHVLRNALLPVVTIMGPLAAYLVTGSFMIENVFGVPGIGKSYVESIGDRDYALIMGTTLFYGLVVALANLVVDLAYGFIDPRTRRGALG